MSFFDKYLPRVALASERAPTATTLRVGPGEPYGSLADAIAASHDGDTVLVRAGTYTHDFADLAHPITLQAVGGMVVVEAARAA